MSDIGPGDAVECINDEGGLKLGAVYFVKTFVPKRPFSTCDTCNSKGTPILLANAPIIGNYWAFCTCQFRPFKGPEQKIAKQRELQCNE